MAIATFRTSFARAEYTVLFVLGCAALGFSCTPLTQPNHLATDQNDAGHTDADVADTLSDGGLSTGSSTRRSSQRASGDGGARNQSNDTSAAGGANSGDAGRADERRTSAGTSGKNAGAGGGTSAPPCTAAAETCDGKDNDCDERVDEDMQTRCWVDADGDGYAAPNAMVTESCDECGEKLTSADPATAAVDCDDADATKSPGATDICGDHVDNDCDGTPDNKSDNACGGPCTMPLPGKPGDKCSNQLKGACARSGVYQCMPDRTMKCSAEQVTGMPEVCGDASDNDCDGVTDNGCMQNACGGWNELEHPRGSSCSVGEGACRVNGTYRCKGEDQTECNAVPKAQNACGGCAVLTPAKGAPCTAECGGTGEYVCDGNDATRCNAVAGAENACGGCDRLSPAYGSTCSADCAGSGTYVCDGKNATRCSVTAKQRNPCRGCNDLPNYGDNCKADCGAAGAYQCDGTERTICKAISPVVRNECEGCAPIPEGHSAKLPDFCSDGVNVTCVSTMPYICTGVGDDRTTSCPAVGRTPDNKCGGCGPLAGEPGTSCTASDGFPGVWTCFEGMVDCY